MSKIHLKNMAAKNCLINTYGKKRAKIFFLNPMSPHVPYGLRGLPPGCGRNVTDFWGWGAHEAQLRSPDVVDGDIWIWSEVDGDMVIWSEVDGDMEWGGWWYMDMEYQEGP
jgi:hypothetical protein